MCKIIALFLCLAFSIMIVARNRCEEVAAEVEAYLKKEDFASAKNLLSKWDIENPYCKALQELFFAEINIYEGNSDLAEYLLQNSLATKAFQENHDYYIKAHYLLSLVLLDKFEEDRAIIHLDAVLEEKDALLATGVYDEVLDLRINLHTKNGEHEQAMQLLKIAFTEAKQQNDTENQIYWLNQIATNYHALGQTDSAIHHFHPLIEFKKLREDNYGLLSDYSTLGGLYQKLGDYQAAQQQLMFAIEIAEQQRDTFSLITTYIDIANNYLEQRLLQPALIHAQQAEILSKQKSMLLNEGNSFMVQAQVYELSKDLEKAALIYKDALAIFEQLGLKQQSADAQIKIADIENSPQSLTNAAQKLEELIQVQIVEENKLGELDARIVLSKISLRLNRNKLEILKELNKAKDLAIATNNTTALMEIYQIRSYIFEQKGDYKAALHNYRSFTGIQDTLLNQENAKMLRELEKQYETEKKDKELTKNKAELERQRYLADRRKNRITQMLLGILAMGLMIAFGMFAYFRNQHLAKQRLEVIAKKRETEVLRAMVIGEEQERQRIAKDLHDSLGAIMASAKMRVSALQYKLPKLKDLEGFHKAEELIDDACDTVREVSHNMMPGALSKYGLERAIEKMCYTIREANPNLEVDFIAYGLENLQDEFVQTNVYRILQELLKNTINHAEASELIVQSIFEDGTLNITVEDDGKGFDKTTIEEGIGLGSIRSRVLCLNGILTLDSTIGSGSTFIIDIPIKNEKHD